jgi:hypothetical protein
VTGLHNPHKCTLRVGVFNKRKLTATFSDPENQVQVPAVWIDRAGVKASLTEVSEGTATSDSEISCVQIKQIRQWCFVHQSEWDTVSLIMFHLSFGRRSPLFAVCIRCKCTRA